jgi:hypothetical protein
MPDRPRRNSAFLIVLVVLLSAGMTYYHLAVFRPRTVEARRMQGWGGGYNFGDDFYPIWLTSREAMLRHRDPYTTEMTRDIQTGLFGRPLSTANPYDPPTDYRTFAYPAFTDVLLWPLSLSSFPALRLPLAAVLAVMTVASLWLWGSALRFHLNSTHFAIALFLTLSSYSVLEALYALQIGLFVGFVLSASFEALARNRFSFAGMLFSLTFIKPQMSILLAAYLLVWSFSNWRERRGLVWALLLWSAALGATSLLVFPHWISEWLHIISGYGGYSQPPLLTYSLGPVFGPRLGPPLTIVLFFAAVILIWKMRGEPAISYRFSLTVSLLLAITSITILPGQAVYDHVILLPGILLIARRWREVISGPPLRIVLAAAALALFWQWIVLIPLLILRYVLPPAKFYSDSVRLLPFHAAASVPLALTAVLGYMMVKTLRHKASV